MPYITSHDIKTTDGVAINDGGMCKWSNFVARSIALLWAYK